MSTTTSVINIPSHFFNTNEELTYTPDSTFIGIAGTAVSIGATAIDRWSCDNYFT